MLVHCVGDVAGGGGVEGEFDAAHQAGLADFFYLRVRLEWREQRCEVGGEARYVREGVFALEEVERREGGGACDRVAGVAVAVEELACGGCGGEEGFVDFARGEDGA